jgi:hypothetical protein
MIIPPVLSHRNMVISATIGQLIFLCLNYSFRRKHFKNGMKMECCCQEINGEERFSRFTVRSYSIHSPISLNILVSFASFP